jgi:hypothetical protein
VYGKSRYSLQANKEAADSDDSAVDESALASEPSRVGASDPHAANTATTNNTATRCFMALCPSLITGGLR